MPTGSGKTIVAAEIVRACDLPTLWLVHRRELVLQAAAALRPCGIIMAGERTNPAAQIQVASVQTLANRTPPPADLIVIDEAHHTAADTYSSILGHYNGAAWLGLTATPFRLDNAGLGDFFGRIIVGAYPDELCADGTLIEPRVYAPPGPDLRGIRTVAGDYASGESAERMGRIVGDAVSHYQRHAAGRRAVAFCVNINHSMQTVAAFQAAGIAAEHLDAGTPLDDRKSMLARLASGETLILSQCHILTEGWDLPALEVAIVLRPTQSLNLHLQMLGRIMRAAPGKLGALVLDHAGNHDRHGPVTQRLEYSLDDEVKPASDGGLIPTRRCMKCYLISPAYFTECPGCGTVFPLPEAPKAEAGELAPWTPRPELPFPERAAAWLMLEERRNAYCYKPGWSAIQYKQRFGSWPVVASGRLVNPRGATMDDKRAVHHDLDLTRMAKGFAPGWTAHRYRAIFGVWPRGI